MQHPDTFVCPISWTLCTEAQKDRLYDEIILEIDPEMHPLAGFRFDVVAQNDDNDVLVQIEDGAFDFAVIHLTWSGKMEEGDLPEIVLFMSREEWADRYMKDAA